MSPNVQFLTLILQYQSPSPPTEQWQSQPPPGYRPPPIVKGFCARFGFILLIFAIIGIIIFYAVPWFTVSQELSDYDNGGDQEYIGNYGQDFEWMFGDDELEDQMDEYLDYGYGYNSQDLLGDTIGLAIIGLIFILIISIIALIIGWLPNFHDRWPKVSKAIDATFGVITILPTMLILFCGMRFLGLNLEYAHSVSASEHLGYDVSGWVAYPAAYILLILGIIILVFSISIIRQGMNGIIDIEYQERKARRQAKRSHPQPSTRSSTPQIRHRY